MSYNVTFSNMNLADYCKVLNIKRDIIPNRINFQKEIPTMMGAYYTGYKYDIRTIELEIAMIAENREELRAKIRSLAEVLNVESPSILEISDEPNLYCYAIPDGSTDYDKLFNTMRATITFICHDPFFYSKEWKTFEPTTENIISLFNEGTIETDLHLNIDFNKNCCFFQCTNPYGETVLIGTPKDSTKPVVASSTKVLDDHCIDSSNFMALAGSLVDGDREATGQWGVGYNGTGLIATNYGSETEGKWHGAAFKRNLGQNISEFLVEVDVVFTSKGKNYTIPNSGSSGGSGGGGPAPQPPPPPPPSPAPNYGTYEVTAKSGLWINREANTKNRLYAMKYRTKVYPSEFSKDKKWIKHTHKVSNSKSYTGWSSAKYLKKISNSKSVEPRASEYAEYQMGLLEIYGYNSDGAKLFKLSISDVNEYYEYVEPEVFIGSKLVLDDGKKCPSPRVVKIKDDNGKVTGEKKVESGVFGDWNDLIGKITIKREKNSKGQYLWSASVNKYVNGKLSKSMKTSNSLSDESYPKGDLNYLGFYIASYDRKFPVDLVAIDRVYVERLNLKTDVSVETNLEIFKEGDNLHIDFENGIALLNDKEFLTHIDIGSEFFKVPTGKSQIICRSDDETMSVVAGFQEKFL